MIHHLVLNIYFYFAFFLNSKICSERGIWPIQEGAEEYVRQKEALATGLAARLLFLPGLKRESAADEDIS